MQHLTSSNHMLASHNISQSLARRLILAGTAAALVGALSIVGVSYAQDGQAPQEQQHGHDKANQDRTEKRIEHKIDHLLADATPEQKSKVIAIARAAFNDLHPLREKSRAAHEQIVKLLAQPTIDRAALEQARQVQQQLADQRSQRITQALADAAEVLTPAQRVKLVERLHKQHDGRWNEHASKPQTKD